MLLVTVAFVVALLSIHTVTGHPLADGVIGMILGIHVASHPAANVINLLFSQSGSSGAQALASAGEALATDYPKRDSRRAAYEISTRTGANVENMCRDRTGFHAHSLWAKRWPGSVGQLNAVHR